MKRGGMRFARLGEFAKRCTVIGVLLAVLATVCLGRLIGIQLLEGRSTAQAATQSRMATVPINAKRGRILDTNGNVLAQSVERYTVIGDPLAASLFEPVACGSTQANSLGYCHQIDDHPVGATGAAAVARLLATVLDDVNAMELGAQLDGTGRYLVIRKDVTPEIKRQIDALHLAGVVYCELSSDRIYSTGTQLGALLGGVDDEGNGVNGVEQMMNDVLTGTDGYEVYQQGNGGVEIPGTLADSEAAVDGSDVTLTIDQDVDWYVKKVLDEGREEYGASWAIAAVQDLRTNEIIALEDTDQIEAGTDDAKLNTSRAVSETFEPGSIGKVITMAGLLQTGLHEATDQFTVPYSFTKDGQEFHDAVDHGSEHWTLAGIIENSSNVGTVMAAENYTNEQRYEFLTKFGVGQSTGLNLPGESSGMLAGPTAWDGRTRDTVLFGQGYTTNVLQLTNVVATIANKGVRHQQTLIKSVTDAQGRVTATEQGEAIRVVDEQVAADVLNAMESVAEHYDYVVSVPGYRVASKTGTAEVAGPDGRLTSIICDWSGVIPADNPRFVVTVVIKDPQKGGFGGLTAGPLFAKISEFLMQKYEVPTSSPRTDAIPVDW